MVKIDENGVKHPGFFAWLIGVYWFGCPLGMTRDEYQTWLLR